MAGESTPDDEVAAAWLWKAERDLAGGRHLATDFPEIAIYQAQQAAEKAVKAFLAHRRQRNQRTHDIPALLTMAEALSPGFAAFIDRGGLLSDWAFRFRYPDSGVIELPEREEMARALEYASAIVVFAKSRIHVAGDAD